MSDSTHIMLGMSLPDVDHWSERVTVALGQNPTPFTGPGTNTYLVGTGPRRILLDTGQGIDAYLPVLERALEEAGCEIQEIVLTHGHPDHIGGIAQIQERFGFVGDPAGSGVHARGYDTYRAAARDFEERFQHRAAENHFFY